MKKKSIILLLLPLILGAGLMLYRCIPTDSELSGTVKVKQDINVADATGTITGRVVDASTVEPIEAADVTLIVNGAKRTTTSKTSTDEDLKGYFVFSGVPAGVHRLTISATGYADYAEMVAVNQTYDNTPWTEFVGWIGLGNTFDLTVVVTDEDGTLVEGVTVKALVEGSACGVAFDWDDEYATAVTDSGGIATFSDLNQCLTYYIVATAFDADADNVYDYQTSVYWTDLNDNGVFDTNEDIYTGAIDSDTTIALALTTARLDDAIAEVTNSLGDEATVFAFDFNTITDDDDAIATDGVVTQDTFPGGNGMGPSDSITLVFNYPVALNGEVVLSYNNYLTNPVDAADVDVPGYPQGVKLANTAAMDSTGCILTITPTSTLPTNIWLQVHGSVTAHTEIAFEDDYTTPFDIDLDAYVYDATGLTATPTITADNYDGISSTHFDPGTGIAYTDNGIPMDDVWIEFPYYVEGTIRVIEYTQINRAARPAVAFQAATATECARAATVADPAFTGFTTVLNEAPIDLAEDDAGEMVYTDGVQTTCKVPAPGYGDITWTGTTAGSYYRYDTGIPLMDGDTITFEVDIQDAAGNTYTATLTKTVE